MLDWIRVFEPGFMITSLFVACCAPAFVLPHLQDPTQIRVGVPLQAELGASDPVTTAPGAMGTSDGPAHARRFSFTAPKDGIWCLSMRSFELDSYLVLRDAEGNLLAEDDDGLWPTPFTVPPRHAYLEWNGSAHARFELEAVGLHGSTGSFVLELTEGPRPALTPTDLAKHALEDGRDWVAAMAYDGVDTRMRTTALLDTARRELAFGKPERALSLTQDAEAIYLQLGLIYPSAIALQIYGEANIQLSRLEEADVSFALVGQRLSEAGFLPENPAFAVLHSGALLSRGVGAKEGGRYTQALEHFQASLTIAEQAMAMEEMDGLEPQPPLLAIQAEAMQSQADVLSRLGNHGEARLRFEQALSLMTVAFGPASPHMASTLSNYALNEVILGRPAEALNAAEKALRIQLGVLPPDSLDLAWTHQNIATVAINLSDYERAEEHLNLALRIRQAKLPTGHPRILDLQANLSGLLFKQGRRKAAGALLERTLADMRASQGPSHPATLLCEANWGTHLLRDGKAQEARALLMDSMARSEAARGLNHPDTQVHRYLLARALRSAGEIEEAHATGSKTRALWAEAFGQDHPMVLSADLFLVSLEEQLGQTQVARERAVGAFWSASRLFISNAWSLTEGERFKLLRNHRSALDWALHLMDPTDPESIRQGLALALEWKGRVGRTVLKSQRTLAATASPEAASLQENLQEISAKLGKELRRLPEEITDQDLAALSNLKRQHQSLQRQIFSLAGAPLGAPEDNVDAVLANVPEQGAAVLFLEHLPGKKNAAHIFAWILLGNGDLDFRDLGPSAILRLRIREAMGEDRGAAGLASGPSPMEMLRDAVWSPLQEILQDRDPVLLSPASALAAVPFEIFPGPEQGRYLAETRNFIYLDDLTEVAGMAPTMDSREGDLLVLGAVDFGGQQGKDTHSERSSRATAAVWKFLEGTGEEIDKILKLHTRLDLGASTAIRGQDASEDSLIEKMPGIAYLHLATHGWVENEWLPELEQELEWEDRGEELLAARRRVAGLIPGFLSGLVLANANDGTHLDASMLTAEEVAAVDLTRCRLAVLSACETAWGAERPGEGLVSLRRAFHLAGTRTVIGSLWKTPDKETSDLMTAFYGALWKGKLPPAEALTHARRKLIRDLRRQGIDDFKLWGAFILSGNWR